MFSLLVISLSTNDHGERLVDVAIQEVHSSLHSVCSVHCIRLWSCAVGEMDLGAYMVMGCQL